MGTNRFVKSQQIKCGILPKNVSKGGMTKTSRSNSMSTCGETAPLIVQGTKFWPVYKSQGASRVGNLWIVFSLKIGRIVHLYSDLERDHWLLIEADPDVVEFCEQPFHACASINGKHQRSIPDMWIRRRDGREEIREVKYQKDISKQEAAGAHQLEIQKEWAIRTNASYRIVTDAEIRKNRVKLDNISKMIHAIRCEGNNGSDEDRRSGKAKVIDLIEKAGGNLKLGELIKLLSFAGCNKTLATIYGAILAGDVIANFDDAPLVLETTVSLPSCLHK